MTQTLRNIKVQVPILKDAASIYTPSVYKMFEKKYLNGLRWEVEEQSNVKTVKNYCVFNGKGVGTLLLMIQVMNALLVAAKSLSL